MCIAATNVAPTASESAVSSGCGRCKCGGNCPRARRMAQQAAAQAGSVEFRISAPLISEIAADTPDPEAFSFAIAAASGLAA